MLTCYRTESKIVANPFIVSTRTVPQVKLSLSSINAALASWYDAVRESVSAIVDMKNHESFRMYDRTRIDSSLSNQCSLLVYENSTTGSVEACVVSWTKPFKNLQGRCITLDDTNSIIYPSHFVDKTSFQACFMILPNIGARVRKQAGEQVCTWVLRLQDMCNTATDRGLVHGMVKPSRCAACIFQSDGADTDRVDTDTADDLGAGLHKCALCLQTFHRLCNDQMVRNMQSFMETNVEPMSTCIEPTDIPMYLMTLSCISCSRIFTSQRVNESTMFDCTNEMVFNHLTV